MEQRTLTRLGKRASVVGLGTWQLGADWGDVDEKEALAVLEAAAESGVTFFDTADVYGDGRSEQTIAAFLQRPARTCTSWSPRRWAAASTRSPRTTSWTTSAPGTTVPGATSASTASTWCSCTARRPPSTPRDEVFDALDTLVEEERIAAYGVSVETCAEALTAIARPGVASVQIILNPFRMKPLREVLPAAREAGVGIIARVPLASGLLSGKYTKDTVFAAERPPHLQPARRGLRPGRDLLRRRLRDRRRGRRRVRRAGPRGVHPGPARAALDRPAARRHHRDPRRPLARAGPRQRGRRRGCPQLSDGHARPPSATCTTGGSGSRWRAAGSRGRVADR